MRKIFTLVRPSIMRPYWRDAHFKNRRERKLAADANYQYPLRESLQ